jgi:hypothetical protein
VQANFAEWESVHLIRGAVPDTLGEIDSDAVAFAHLDMNSARPEAEAAAFLWPRMIPGAFMLLDDYGFRGYEAQKRAMDSFANERGLAVLSLPTGQGLIHKT